MRDAADKMQDAARSLIVMGREMQSKQIAEIVAEQIRDNPQGRAAKLMAEGIQRAQRTAAARRA